MSLAIWPLAAQNVSLYPLAPGGTKFYRHATPLGSILNNVLTPEGSYVSCYLAPGGIKFYRHATPSGSIFKIS